MASGRVVAATESWWRLGTPEAVLLPWMVASLPPQAARDYPVYLPHGSPTVRGVAMHGGVVVREVISVRAGPGGGGTVVEGAGLVEAELPYKGRGLVGVASV